MTAKELAKKTVRDIARRREKVEKDFYGYQKEQSIKKKRGWNIKYGGTRW